MTLNTLADLVGPSYLALFKAVGLIAFGALLVLFAQLAWETFGLPLRMRYGRRQRQKELARYSMLAKAGQKIAPVRGIARPWWGEE